MIKILLLLALVLGGCSTKANEMPVKRHNPPDIAKVKDDGLQALKKRLDEIYRCAGDECSYYAEDEAEISSLRKQIQSYHDSSFASLDLSRFGVKNHYEVDEERDVNTLKHILKDLIYEYQLYTSDSDIYDKDDFHENIAPYLDFLHKHKDLRGDRAGFQKLYRAYGYDDRHFEFKDGQWWVRGDCESTYLAIETFAIRYGINPQRLLEAYVDVMTDFAKTTPAGGHMFGIYIGASGKNYTLEQLPYTRTLYELSTQHFYKMIDIRRADQPIHKFKKVPQGLIDAIDNNLPIKLTPTNEG